jgi:LAS superfamily LD-carboxypeptidase LdcB
MRRASLLRPRATVIAVALAALLGGALPGAGASAVEVAAQQDLNPQETKERRDQVRRERAAAAAQINSTEASIDEANAALDVLAANVAAQQNDLADAQAAVVAARDAVGVARQRVTDTEAQLNQLATDLKQIAVNEYLEPRQRGDLVDILTVQDPQVAIARDVLFEVRSGRVVGDTDRAAALREDLDLARMAAEAAEIEAQDREADEAVALTNLYDAQEQQEAVAADLEARLERSLSEARGLESLDAQLTQQYESEQAELSRRLEEARRQQEEARRRAAAAAAASNAAPRPPASTRSQPQAPAIDDPGEGNTEVVRGIRVASSIAGQVGRMIDAAAADGITLAGGGYRSSQAQIAVRRNNCGSSDYAIYEMPASQCNPPTARPGNSEHERGLAIDFTCNGAGIISSRSSPCFQWLAANAASYGFYNLPSEPWHWSTSGR